MGEMIAMIVNFINIMISVTAAVLQYCEYRLKKNVTTTRICLPLWLDLLLC